MEILQQISKILAENNTRAREKIQIDTIRATFYKNTLTKRGDKIYLLRDYARARALEWRKLDRADPLRVKIVKRSEFKGLKLANIYKLGEQNIYYATTACEKDGERHKAILEIYGISQYHKAPPSPVTASEILRIINTLSSVDLCVDSPHPFNLKALSREYSLNKHQNTTYLNRPPASALERVYFYDKAKKNNLNLPVFRAEATAVIYDLGKPQALEKSARLEAQLLQALTEFREILSRATAS